MLPEIEHEWWQGRREVLVVADAEAVTRHVHAAAEPRLLNVHGDEIVALVRGEHRSRDRVAIPIQRAE
jgi:hypothetical protein